MWKELVKETLTNALAFDESINIKTLGELPDQEPVPDLTVEMAAIAREVAKLDGFDITLRSLEIDQSHELKDTKHWVVPVRDWLKNDEWQSEDGQLKGSHDADGRVCPAYVEAMLNEGLYDEKGKLKEDLLDPDCIEARDWNLSAGQYKPFDFTQLKSDKSVAELITELKNTEQQIIKGLDTLLAMVEGRA
jgi:type I restriction enzyme M protein